MVVIKYKKSKEGIFFSPEEIKKLLDRLLSICGVDVEHEKNKKKTHFCSPAVVGVESKCEYIFIDTSDYADNIENKIVNVLPEWLEIEYIYDIDGELNFEEVKTSALYEINFDDYKENCQQVVKFFEKNDDFLTKYALDSCEVEEEKIEVITSAGEDGTKVIDLVKDILKSLDREENYYNLSRKELYINSGVNKIKDFDEVINDIKQD